jgi:hypothetical protein
VNGVLRAGIGGHAPESGSEARHAFASLALRINMSFETRQDVVHAAREANTEVAPESGSKA